jgi:hypothetical protein
MLCQPKELKSVHRPLALKSPIILRDSLLVSGNQCFPSVTVSSCRRASAFHQVTPHGMWLAREPGAGSRDKESGEQGLS